MSRFYLNETYLPRVKKLLEATLTIAEIADRLGFKPDSVREFIKKHGLNGRPIKKPIAASREEAKETKTPFYLGEPCENSECGNPIRYTVNGCCRECAKEACKNARVKRAHRAKEANQMRSANENFFKSIQRIPWKQAMGDPETSPKVTYENI